MAQIGAAHAAIGAGFEQPQELDLHAQRDVAHLIEKQRAAVGGFHQTGLGMGGPREGAFLVPEQLGLEQALGQAGAVDHHDGLRLAMAGGMDRVGHPFLARARFSPQQHAGLRRGHAGHQVEHVPEGRGFAHQRVLAGLSLRDGQGFHLLDEEVQRARSVMQGNQLDAHIDLAMRRMVQVQHLLALARNASLCERAGLAGLVAGHGGVVGGLMAAPPDQGLAVAVLPAVGRIGRHDGVVPVAHDVWLGHAFEVGDQVVGNLHGA